MSFEAAQLRKDVEIRWGDHYYGVTSDNRLEPFIPYCTDNSYINRAGFLAMSEAQIQKDAEAYVTEMRGRYLIEPTPDNLRALYVMKVMHGRSLLAAEAELLFDPAMNNLQAQIDEMDRPSGAQLVLFSEPKAA